MRHSVIGILAHVDAGKTTLSEAMLYAAGKIRQRGRVDHRNTYLDTHELERERGITIFAKQAIFTTNDLRVTLLDTPGHVDFSGETERTLSVLDYAILVISATDGVQAHTETLWHLLTRYHVPVFLFVTKMDLTTRTREEIMADLTAHLDPACVDFSSPDAAEHIAMCDETLLEQYLAHNEIEDRDIAALTVQRRLFPCFFGSGLHGMGIDALLDALSRYTLPAPCPASFSAKVYKIGHDKNGTRVTYLRVTGGSLAVRQIISYHDRGASEERQEKITAIRFYSGDRFESADKAECGEVCAVIGLTATYAGQTLGEGEDTSTPFLEPVLNYRVSLPADLDARTFLPHLRELEEEEPLLHIVWDEQYGEIHARLMGEVQCEILIDLIRERFGVEITLGDCRILYRETITEPVEGIGHFEPLRHYAEVHLLLEPLPPGSGMRFFSRVSEAMLERNWQHLIVKHLEEKQHIGVLCGAPLTDVKITVIAGRSHIKHTQSSDFREAALRAVRHGLMRSRERGQCVLLEPFYAFRLELPGECVGRAISDIIARSGTFEEHETSPGISVLTGRAPVQTLSDYAREVTAYTHGRGRFSCRLAGYFPCHDADRVIAAADYRPEADLANPPDSVFCAHGAGFLVPWQQVHEYMHLEAMEKPKAEELRAPQVIRKNLNIDEKELEALMEREFGPIRRRTYGTSKQVILPDRRELDITPRRSLYIVDGYNVIFAWEELAAIAAVDLENARRQLCEILANYQAFTQREIIVVFDAYNVHTAQERRIEENGLHIVYTKEGELADTYIEQLTDRIGRDLTVRVITSDGLVQLQALRTGVMRMSAREFREEILATDREIDEILKKLRET